ncbi:MAG: nuclear transport factor 2 family protein [Mycobacteriales bacterium]|nr:nuclear transport factor 2 family protein [Mycobacteriales bacterium]
MDEEQTARQILDDLQTAVASKDLDRVVALLDDDVVVFGTAAANLGLEQTTSYLAALLQLDGTVRWGWDHVLPLASEPGLLAFAVLGTAGVEDDDGVPDGDPDPFRLTCVAVLRDDRWRLRHFHGSFPYTD